MIYRFYLDGTLIKENPDGWDQMNTRISRDTSLKTVLVNLNATLTFRYDGYQFFKTKFDRNYCEFTSLRIDASIDEGQNFSEWYNGTIFNTDLEILEFRHYAKCTVTDNSFYAWVKKNASLEAVVLAGKSKNGDDITIPPVYELEMFMPADGSYNGSGVNPNLISQVNGCFFVYDIFKYLISFMTDNAVLFDSTLFAFNGEFGQAVLTYGRPVRFQGDGQVITIDDFTSHLPKLAFQKLFDEYNRRINLGIFIDYTTSKPTLRIEKWDDLFGQTNVISIADIPDIISKISANDVYSQLKIGSQPIADFSYLSFPESIAFLGFKEETYLITGKCNVERTLDLTCDFITSSNVIEYILTNPSDLTYDTDWMIVDCEYIPFKFHALQSNWITPPPPPYFYNERFINSNVALRYLKAVPNAIADWLGSGNDTFLSELTFDIPNSGIAATITDSPCQFDNDYTAPNHDVNNRYGNGTAQGLPVSQINSRYTCLLAGIYSFEAHRKINVTSIINPDHYIQVSTVVGSFINGENITIAAGVATATLIYYDAGSSIMFLSNCVGVFTNGSPISGDSSGASAIEVLGLVGFTPTSTGIMSIKILRYDVGSVLKATYNGTVISNFGGGNHQLDVLTSRIYAQAGDYLIVETVFALQVSKIFWDVKATSVFLCDLTMNGGGIFQTYDPADYPIFQSKFEIELPKNKWDLIKNNPLSLIEFFQDVTNKRVGWIDTLDYDNFKGILKATLLYSKNIK